MRRKALLHDLVQESGILRQKTNEQRQQLQRELEDVERRIKRWEDGFETGTVTAELGGDRVRELRARREELMSTLSQSQSTKAPRRGAFTTRLKFALPSCDWLQLLDSNQRPGG